MILLTGASGNVGRALLRRLLAEDRTVRCLVRDPRRIPGAERVRVQIALGDLGVPGSLRNALRGVKTVVHLAASPRDQPGASIEELNGMATFRLLRAAERAGAERFVFFSALGASLHSRSRFFRAKALAERAVAGADIPTTIFAPSIVYSPGDRWLRLLEQLSRLPAMPVPGGGRTRYQPIWAEDVAACVMGALEGRGAGDGTGRLELGGPEVLSYDEFAASVLRAAGRTRRTLHVPLPLVHATLRAGERVLGPAAVATWDEAELMGVPMTTARGTADAEALGVSPAALPTVLAGRSP